MAKKKKEIKHPCQNGLGFGRKLGIDPHEMSFQGRYDDRSRDLRGIRLTYVEAKAAYTCRKCGLHMGCAVCIEDVSELVCRNCRDWANDISERVHGKMIKSAELKQVGMKLVLMIAEGKIGEQDFDKLWNDARANLRDGPERLPDPPPEPKRESVAKYFGGAR